MKMMQHERMGARVVQQYEVDTLGAPFKVRLWDCVSLGVDPKTGEEKVHIPDLVGLISRPSVSCTLRRVAPHCTHRVDVALATLPKDQHWSRIGPAMLCSECGEPGRVNITPNWHDMDKLQVSKWWHTRPR